MSYPIKDWSFLVGLPSLCFSGAFFFSKSCHWKFLLRLTRKNPSRSWHPNYANSENKITFPLATNWRKKSGKPVDIGEYHMIFCSIGFHIHVYTVYKCIYIIYITRAARFLNHQKWQQNLCSSATLIWAKCTKSSGFQSWNHNTKSPGESHVLLKGNTGYHPPKK